MNSGHLVRRQLLEGLMSHKLADQHNTREPTGASRFVLIDKYWKQAATLRVSLGLNHVKICFSMWIKQKYKVNRSLSGIYARAG